MGSIDKIQNSIGWWRMSRREAAGEPIDQKRNGYLVSWSRANLILYSNRLLRPGFVALNLVVKLSDSKSSKCNEGFDINWNIPGLFFCPLHGPCCWPMKSRIAAGRRTPCAASNLGPPVALFYRGAAQQLFSLFTPNNNVAS